MKFKLHLSKPIKILLYICLIFFVILLNAIFACLSYSSNAKSDTEELEYQQSEQDQINTSILITIISFVLESGGIIYCMIQDLLGTEESGKKKKNSQTIPMIACRSWIEPIYLSGLLRMWLVNLTRKYFITNSI